MPSKLILEACIDSVDSGLSAQQAGADRVELCDDLVEGGTTPSAAMIELCAERLAIPVFVIIRPRGGDFLYTDTEFEIMRRDVARVSQLGAGGVVLGVLRSDGTVDVERTRVLIEEARPLPVTFHRAFDVTRDADEALDALLELGVDRVLSSGRAEDAAAGIPTLARMVEHADGRITVLAGGGIREDNVQRVIVETGVPEIHVRGARQVRSPMGYRNPRVAFGGRRAPLDDIRVVTDGGRIERLRQLGAEAMRS